MTYVKKIILLTVILIISTTAISLASQDPKSPPSSLPRNLFDPIASVLTHPRCINCHQADFPHQKDTGIRHNQYVVRGHDDNGTPTLRCSTCHQSSNMGPNGKVPGVRGWHMAPLSMKWEGLSKAQICEQIKDPAKNGNRKTLSKVIEHMKVDPLVLWAWNPGGGRTTPPMSHSAFVLALEHGLLLAHPAPKN